MTPRQAAILRVLPTGAANAMTGRDLWPRVTGERWSEGARRCLSGDIEALWKEGRVICSTKAGDPKGYYLPADSDELARYIAQFASQVRREEERLRTAEDALEAMRSPVQGHLFGGGAA